MTTPEQAVRRFIAAWNAMDFDAIIDGLAQDIYYHNMPMEPVVGIDGVREYLRSAWTFSECHWDLINIAVANETVLTERVDAFVINGRSVVLPLMGVLRFITARLLSGEIISISQTTEHSCKQPQPSESVLSGEIM